MRRSQIAVVLPIIVDQYPFYAPMSFALYTLGLRYCHVAAMRWEKLTSDGVIAIEETYDVSANVFGSVDQRKKAPPVIALEPRTLELVRWHRRYLTRRNHPGIKTGLLFPSEAGRPVGNDQIDRARHASTLHEWIATMIRAHDEKYVDLPERVSRLESAAGRCCRASITSGQTADSMQ
jgi:hypothetical protein